MSVGLWGTEGLNRMDREQGKYLAASRVERVPMGLTRWMARSPRRL